MIENEQINDIYNPKKLAELKTNIIDSLSIKLKDLARTDTFFERKEVQKKADSTFETIIHKPLFKTKNNDGNYTSKDINEYIDDLVSMLIEVLLYEFSDAQINELKSNNKPKEASFLEERNLEKEQVIKQYFDLFNVGGHHDHLHEYNSFFHTEIFLKKVALILDSSKANMEGDKYTIGNVDKDYPELGFFFKTDENNKVEYKTAKSLNATTFYEYLDKIYDEKLAIVNDIYWEYYIYGVSAYNQRNDFCHNKNTYFDSKTDANNQRDYQTIFYLRTISNVYESLKTKLLVKDNFVKIDDLKSIHDIYVDIPWILENQNRDKKKIKDIISAPNACESIKAIRANAGCGKTTAVKELCYDAVNGDGQYIPIYIEVKKIQEIKDKTFRDIICEYVLEDNKHDNNLIDHLFSQGRLLLIFDGVDEAVVSKKELMNFIKNDVIAKQEKPNLIFITSRYNINSYFPGISVDNYSYDNTCIYDTYVGTAENAVTLAESLIDKHNNDNGELKEAKEYFKLKINELRKIFNTPFLIEKYIELYNLGKIKDDFINDKNKFYREYINIMIRREVGKDLLNESFLYRFHEILRHMAKECESQTDEVDHLLYITEPDFNRIIDNYISLDKDELACNDLWSYFTKKCDSLGILMKNDNVDINAYSFVNADIYNAILSEID